MPPGVAIMTPIFSAHSVSRRAAPVPIAWRLSRQVLSGLLLVAAWVSIAEVGAAESKSRLVLLMDKHCPLCRSCVPYSEARRQPGKATLTLIERSGANFIIRKSWQATYGLSEGPKACLYDNRTPEGLYHTSRVSRNRDVTYGYIAIITSYPNWEDLQDLKTVGSPPSDKCLCSDHGKLRNRQWNLCNRVCTDAGAGIAIHGGHAGQTRGCIRVLDPGTDPKQRSPIHYKAIAELAAFVEAEPEATVPVISVIDVAEGCRSDVGQAVSRGCAEALRAILDTTPSPSRDRVSRLLAEARGLPVRGAKPPAPPPPAVVAQPLPSGAPDSVLRSVQVESVLASSEAKNCGASGGEPCAASHLSSATTERAWCEAVPGTGDGQWLRFVFASPHTVSRVEIQNGFWEKGPGSQSWFERGYVTAVELVVDGKSTPCSHPQEDPTQLDCDLEGVQGRSLLLRLKGAAPGETMEETCISHVTILTKDPTP